MGLTRTWIRSLRLAALFGLLIALSAGCESAQRAQPPLHTIADGEFGRARMILHQQLIHDRSDRNYLLGRMRLAMITLADGYPNMADETFSEVFEVLRTQGINADKTVASVVLNEDLKFWKGEPFEQAMALSYIALQQGMLGDWDNMRAASQGSLFHLRDFGADEQGDRLDAEGIARRALQYERAAKRGENPKQSESPSNYLNTGYAVRESDFVFGYLLHGVASAQMDRRDEAKDHYLTAAEIEPVIEPLAHELIENDYNTLLVVSFGLGPRKIGYGPDRAIAGFTPRFESDASPLMVRKLNDDSRHWYPVVCDVNRMAQDHRWNNLEDIRRAKSTLGSLLLFGGAAATAYGADRHSEEALYAGLGAMAAGLFLKAGAHADTRHCETLPQRFYLVPLKIDETDSVIELMVRDKPATRLRLAGLSPPSRSEGVKLRYVRLVSGRKTESKQPPAWATSGDIFYSNSITGAARSGQDTALPYILGGCDVRIPSEAVLNAHQSSGHLQNITLAELEELHRAQGIDWDPAGRVDQHVLEGGRSLRAPLEGTAGFARLFGQRHPPYQPIPAEAPPRH